MQMEILMYTVVNVYDFTLGNLQKYLKDRTEEFRGKRPCMQEFPVIFILWCRKRGTVSYKN